MGISYAFIGLRKAIMDRYRKICPYSEKTILHMALKCCRKTWIVSGICFIAIVVFNIFVEGKITAYSIVSALYLGGLLFMSVPEWEIKRKEDALLGELIYYLAEVKRKYIYLKNVPDAVMRGAEGKSEEIVKNAAEMGRILLVDNRRKAVREYIENPHKNRFLKLFLIQAYETSENGDSEGMTFSDNIELLRLEIIDEIYSRKKRKYVFSGYMFVAVFPVLLMGIVKKTALALSAGLTTFYEGTGIFIILIAFLTSGFVVSVLKDNSEEMKWNGEKQLGFGRTKEKTRQITNLFDDYVERTDSKTLYNFRRRINDSGRKMKTSALILKMLFITVITMTVGMFFLFTQRDSERKAVISRVENIDRIVVLAKPQQKQKMEEAILSSVKSIVNSGGMTDQEQILKLFRDNSGNRFRYYEEACCSEILRRVEKYDNLKVHWYEGTIVLMISVMTGMLPLLRLYMDCGIRKKASSEEIKRFQTILLMERGFNTLSVVNLLTDLELFADVFKSEIKECINTYATGPYEALLRLKTKGSEKNPLFTELADGFIAIDEVGIYEAFSDVSGNRECMEKMEELSETIDLDKKKSMLDIVAWLPGIIVIFGYFIIPFLKSSVYELTDLFGLLENPGIL